MFKESTNKVEKKDKFPKYFKELSVFSNFSELTRKAEEIQEELTVSVSNKSDEYKEKLKEHEDRLIRASFLKTSLLIPYRAFRAYYQQQKLRKTSKIDVHEEAIKKTKDVIGDIIREIALNTDKVETLRKIYKEKTTKLEDNPFWIKNSSIEDLIERINRWGYCKNDFIKKKWIDYARAIIAQSLGISESNVRPFITANILSNLCFRRLIFGLILQAMFIYVFEEDFIPLGFDSEDCIIGNSGIRRYFDGFLRLNIPEQGEKIFLLKLVNLSIGDTGIICSTGISLQDIRKRVKAEVNSIVFIPGYPTSDSLERELYWRNEARINLNLLYLKDFFEMFRLWKKKDVRRFLIEKLK